MKCGTMSLLRVGEEWEVIHSVKDALIHGVGNSEPYVSMFF